MLDKKLLDVEYDYSPIKKFTTCMVMYTHIVHEEQLRLQFALRRFICFMVN